MQRLFQISKELNIHYTDIISFLDGKGIKVSSHMATIDEDVYQIILNKFYNKKTHSRPKRKKKIIKKLVSREDGLGSNKKVKRNYQLDKPKGVRGRNSDNTMIRSQLNWNPKFSLYQGLEQTYKWIFEEIKKKHNQ